MTPHPPTPPRQEGALGYDHSCFLEHPNTPCPYFGDVRELLERAERAERENEILKGHGSVNHEQYLTEALAAAEQRVAALGRVLDEMELTGLAPIGPLYGVGWADAVDTMRTRLGIPRPQPTPPTGGRT